MSEQNIIIFDSPDGTGKTNIAKGLSIRMNVPYFKFSGEHDYWRKNQFKTALEFDQTYLAQLLLQTQHPLIVDRAWPSEWVYSKVYKRETNEDLLKDLDYVYAHMGAWIIIPVRSDYSKNEDDELVKKEELQLIHDKYMEFVYWTTCNTMILYVDSFGNDLIKELNAIQPALNLNGKNRNSVVLKGR